MHSTVQPFPEREKSRPPGGGGGGGEEGGCDIHSYITITMSFAVFQTVTIA